MNSLFDQYIRDDSNKKIAIIGNPNEFLLQGLSDAFREKGFFVMTCAPDVNEINRLPDSIKIYVVIHSSNQDMTFLWTYLHDIVYEQHICICPIIQKIDLHETEQVFPLEDFAEVFLRPVNAKAIANEIDSLFKKERFASRKKSILVVDDDPEYLRHIQKMLHNQYMVYLANSGTAAFMLLGKHPVDLILLDYQMPGLDGPGTLEALRIEPSLMNTPVMFLTNMQDIASVARAAQLRPENYVLKTTPAEILITTISDFFAKQEYMQ